MNGSSIFSVANPPAVHIRIALEEPLRVTADWLHEDGELRMRDWLNAHPELNAIVSRALELERAA